MSPAAILIVVRHLSVISGISPDGELFLMAQERALNSADVARFLRHLLEILPEPLLVIWDGGPIHRGQPVKDLLAEVGRDRLLVERLPAYAPELNPDEGIWNYLKRVELRNTCCPSLRHLREALRDAAIRLCQKPHIIRGCIREAGYRVEPPCGSRCEGPWARRLDGSAPAFPRELALVAQCRGPPGG